MKKLFYNYGQKEVYFHIKGSLKGMLLGLPICALVGALVEVF